MLRLRIISPGKVKELWLKQALLEYTKRLKGEVSFDFVWVKDDEELLKACAQEKEVVALDPQGERFTSQEFSVFLHNHFVKGGSQLAIVVGGAEGLPDKIKKTRPLVSLSPLTFTHQIVRLVLVEQVYRSIQIYKNSPYHK